MKTIKSLDSLNTPNKYKRYITQYLSNLKENRLFHHVNKVILFGEQYLYPYGYFATISRRI